MTIVNPYAYATRVARSLNVPEASFDDAVQEAVITWSRYRDHPSKTYVSRAMRLTVVDFKYRDRITGRQPGKIGCRVPPEMIVSSDAETDEGGPVYQVADRQDVAELATDRVMVESAVSVLDDRERDIVDLYSRGHTFASIGREVGYSRNYTRQLFGQALDKMRNHVGA